MTYNVLSPRRGMWELDPAEDYVYEDGGGRSGGEGVTGGTTTMTTSAYAATRGFVTAYASSSSRGFGSSGGVGVRGGEGGNDNDTTLMVSAVSAYARALTRRTILSSLSMPTAISVRDHRRFRDERR